MSPNTVVESTNLMISSASANAGKVAFTTGTARQQSVVEICSPDITAVGILHQKRTGTSRLLAHLQNHDGNDADQLSMVNRSFRKSLQGSALKVVSIEDEYSFSVPSADIISKTQSLASTLNVLPPHLQKATHRPKIIAHRGALYHEPENTLPAFRKAAECGADAVELDCFLLKCGTLVVFHGFGTDEDPGWFQGYCQSSANILDMTYAEVQGMKFDKFGSEFACHPSRMEEDGVFIPTLEQVLMQAKEMKYDVTIELKGPGTAEPSLELVERLDMVDNVVFSSFSHDRIARIRELRQELNLDGTHRYKTGCLFTVPPDNFVDIAMEVGASEVHLRYDECSKQRIDLIHANGMSSMAWFRGYAGMLADVSEKYLDVGNEDEDMYHTVLNSGVKQLCMNKPDVLVDMLNRRFPDGSVTVSAEEDRISGLFIQ